MAETMSVGMTECLVVIHGLKDFIFIRDKLSNIYIFRMREEEGGRRRAVLIGVWGIVDRI